MVFFVRKFAKMPKIKLEREYSVAKLPNFEKRFEFGFGFSFGSIFY